jgi:hypothetical protein
MVEGAVVERGVVTASPELWELHKQIGCMA